ncbi:MAG: hypothetical protein LW814_09880 [Anabaena sp. CoA2_C59]|uniref:Protein NO VEIN C-terminal domain-containing protein n=1 Tax=Aphanizomenon flos-aquae FACHB-1249 TaxID=2692889 RepID=A0ABR8IQX6_APHFL|nr:MULTISPECIES: hypothetical protein [Aphanizomenon]MCE2905324.1 hypothetical protein [Anabaena sp. CoA2_C59]MDJ0507032.1 hypothetical protein [Nostocales cyanobacterium LE14-WE12]MBD2390479.1 hypothetical protein [Aphanizomenon flos-aquae FACHB-1171]MBD2555984.1 hypothetical protein [Aphanizomenon flos-aquae FACHB-1290]MBD2631484.1 hypothetical protein [Aphanizomenon sp. FACHB-1399]
MNLDKCSEKITHKNILIEEKKSSKIIFGNENLIEVTKVQVDGCLDIQGVKCDWLLIIYEPYIEIYIELKGSDVEHAFIQIENTIKVVSQDYKNVPKYCYIITTRCPLDSTQIQVKKKSFKSKYNAVLKVKKTGCNENINVFIPQSN